VRPEPGSNSPKKMVQPTPKGRSSSITDRETTDFKKSNCPSIKEITAHPKTERDGVQKNGIEHSARC
ncbi:hypothetical protein, partial [Agromyces tropicus]|uniref:hypothetical protein n=1 Tax=Agromyces tropicus TaxID=555371 RepID=UPI0031DDDBF7